MKKGIKKMNVELIKKCEIFENEKGEKVTTYPSYVVINGLEIKIKPVFKNHKAVLSAFSTLKNEK